MIIDGTTFSDKTNPVVAEIIEARRKEYEYWNGHGARPERIRIFYGDAVTGLDWEELFGNMGYVGRSCGGSISVPLLIYNSKSLGGGSILTDCIVKITWARDGDNRQPLWIHPFYHTPGEAEVKAKGCWSKACEHDKIDPESKFVVFSDDNPFIEEQSIWNLISLSERFYNTVKSPRTGQDMSYVRQKIKESIEKRAEKIKNKKS